jgi:hypothetical protein
MSLIAGVRKRLGLFVLVFGVLAPCALAGFGACQAGWEWVSDTLGFSIPRWFDLPRAAELMCAFCPGFQLETTKPL